MTRAAIVLALVLARCASTPVGNPSPTVAVTEGGVPTGPAITESPFPTLSPAAHFIPFEADFYTVAAGPEGVWLLSPTGHVIRIDPTTNGIAADVAVRASEFGHIAVGAGSVWITDFDHDALVRIDAASGAIDATIAVGANPEGLLVTPETIWVSNHRGGSISKVDVASNTVVDTFDFTNHGASGPKGIVIVAGDLWTTVPNAVSVFRIAPATGEVVDRLLIMADDFGSPLTDGRFVYVPTPGGLVKVDPATNALVPDFAPVEQPRAFGLSSAWSISNGDLVRLANDTFAPIERWRVVGESSAVTNMALWDDTVWLATDSRAVIRVDVGS